MPKAKEKNEEKFEKKEKNIVKIVFDIIFWIIIAVLLIVWVTDFILVKKDKKPKFCISHKVHEYDDGKVNECVGLGYKVYQYDRDSLDAKVQFSPFFIGMKE